MCSQGNCIQTLFLISNSFNGFGFGLFLVAFGVGRGVLVGAGAAGAHAACAGVGAALLALACLGCAGAVTMNRRMLDAYSVMMVGGVVYQVAHLAVLREVHAPPALPAPHQDLLRLQAFFVTMIFVVSVTLVSVVLACALSIRIRAATNSSHQLRHSKQ